MQLRILLPFKTFSTSANVARIVAITRSGSFGLLPQRLDCVAVLSPGILSYSTSAGSEVYIAVDEGVLIKTGADVLVCVRHAIGGPDLGTLRQEVEREFTKLDDRQRSVRSALAHLESGFIRRLVEFQRA
jgi:F-type H+-transporting ATPase subunit epsilon